MIDEARASALHADYETMMARYAVGREERSRVIVDLVAEAVAQREAPLVVDLGCGPGSLTLQLADRLPHAEVVGVDTDRVLLALGRRVHGEEVRLVEGLVGAPGWQTAVAGERQVDAVVSSAALHYPPRQELASIYRDLADLVTPGGVVLNADELPEAQPVLGALTSAVEARRSWAADGELDWDGWWERAAAEPALAALMNGGRVSPALSDENGLSAADHETMLRAAGFAEVGVVWRLGSSAVLAAVR